MKTARKKTNIGILGFGHMGQAIFRLLKRQKGFNFFICSANLSKVKNVTCLKNLDGLAKKCDLIFLCVKPQNFYDLKPAAANDKIFVSIMAGVKIKNIKKITRSAKIVRTMPNLPLQIGRGVIAWLAEEKLFKKTELADLDKLLSGCGYSFKVKNETDLDKVTALSGSGPAYIFLFLDALIKGGTNLGLKRAQAEQMVLELTQGSLEYFKSVRNTHSLGKLIASVKSKKGTTAAALDKLNTDNFYKNWRLAIGQAYQRARKISNLPR